jgi:hypothetical protein
VYANRRRVQGEYGKSSLRRLGESVERNFTHCYETAGMRRCHLCRQENIPKRQLIHVGVFNLSLILPKLLGAGTPRELRKLRSAVVLLVLFVFQRGTRRNSPAEVAHKFPPHQLGPVALSLPQDFWCLHHGLLSLTAILGNQINCYP